MGEGYARTMNQKRALVIAGVVIALLLGIIIGQSRGDGSFLHMNGMGHSASDSDEFNSNEIMFAQMMIPHHQQAVEMSELAFTNSTDPEILALAHQIHDAQAPEIEQMKSWLTSSGAGMVMDHDMPMSGMLDDSEISTLTAAKGRAFDRLFLKGMIGHHEGALDMVSMIENSTNAEVKTLAENIVSSQSAEILLMKEYLAARS